MAKIIAIINEKGGVGKTATATALAYLLAKSGKKTALIDFDGQGHASLLCGVDNPNKLEVTISTLLNKVIMDESLPEPESYIFHGNNGVDLIPANSQLFVLERNLSSVDFREYKLSEYVKSITDMYEYIIIDCMLQIGTPMVNVMMCADSIVIPTQAEILSAQGRTELLKHYNVIRKNSNHSLRIEGILITMDTGRTIMNQMYSADVSKKVHSAYVTKAQSGQFTGCLAPFGYRKNPDDHGQLIPDEDTAPIVKLIYDYAKEGYGLNYIRRKLEDRKIPCPAWWNRKKGLRNKFTKFERDDPERGHLIWDFTTIKEILQNPVYIGAIASQKQVYKFKTGWIKDKKPHEWLIVEDMHEPLVSREVFELVQEKVKTRKRPDAFGNYSIFAGLAKCGQCGSTMNIRRANQKGNERIYTCSKYNKYGVKHCSQHRMKYDVLYSIVLEQIRSYAAKALENESEVISQLTTQSRGDFDSERGLIEKSIADDTARLTSIEKLIAKLYEDMVADRISAENFNVILSKSQAEQKALRERLHHSQSRLDHDRQEQDDTARWIELIKEYADIQELDTATLQRLIKKIVIHEDLDGDIIRQTVEIHFNFKGQPDKYKLIRE